jgi:hypothetical protein
MIMHSVTYVFSCLEFVSEMSLITARFDFSSNDEQFHSQRADEQRSIVRVSAEGQPRGSNAPVIQGQSSMSVNVPQAVGRIDPLPIGHS